MSVGKVSSAVQHLFRKCVESVDPGHLVRTAVQKHDPNTIKIHNLSLTVNQNCFVVGFGKATYKMAVELEKILSPHLCKGIISIPERSLAIQSSQLRPDSSIQVFEGAKDNLPDTNAYKAAVNIKLLAEACSKEDILFVLISGGGSALLPCPKSPITIAEKYATVKLLSSVGADIIQINAVRKALSQLKGGKLAISAYPATVVALILSDVVGDPLHVIAAGPTVISNENEGENAINILRELDLYNSVPENIRKVLGKSDAARSYSEDTSLWLHNFVIGNNATALTAAEAEAERMGFVPLIISSRIAGLVSNIAAMYSELAFFVCTYLMNSTDKDFIENLERLRATYKGVSGIEDVVQNVTNCADIIRTCTRNERRLLLLISGGEPTVEVRGDGMGGRNQELALDVAIRMHNLKMEETDGLMNKFDVSFASVGTDGIDGPTDAAGALSYTDLVKDAHADFDLDTELYLRNNDSYSFFSKFRNGSCHIKTGHTGTNVMDVHFLAIGAK